MVRRFRARVACLLTAALLALGTTTISVGELLHGGATHDLACAPGGEAAHDGAAQVAAPDGNAGQPHHCVGCHLARSSRLGAQAATHASHSEASVPCRPAPAIGCTRSPALDGLPPRSPPPSA